MADVIGTKYEAMKRNRAELSEVITGLYEDIDREIASKVQAAFLRYEGAVLELLQDDLDTIDVLIQRVEIAEGVTNG